MISLRLFLFSLCALILSGCASGTFKARQELREKTAANSGLYCEFISGDLFPDIDVEMSLSMGRRCDAAKNYTITNYKNSSDQSGVIYCCSTRGGARTAAVKKSSAPVKVDTSSDSDAAVTAE